MLWVSRFRYPSGEKNGMAALFGFAGVLFWLFLSGRSFFLPKRRQTAAKRR